MAEEISIFTLKIDIISAMNYISELAENIINCLQILGPYCRGQGEHVDPFFALIAFTFRSLEQMPFSNCIEQILAFVQGRKSVAILFHGKILPTQRFCRAVIDPTGKYCTILCQTNRYLDLKCGATLGGTRWKSFGTKWKTLESTWKWQYCMFLNTI